MSYLQEEISKVGSALDALKSKGDSEREEFISKMYEMNAKIRQFRQKVSLELAEYNHSELPATEGQHVRDESKTVGSEGSLKDLADKVSNIEAKVQLLEEEYKKICLIMIRSVRSWPMSKQRELLWRLLLERQSSCRSSATELEKVHASLAEELQRRYACPGSGVNNMPGLEEAAN